MSNVSLVKKVACKDLGDIGVRFNYNNTTYKALKPFGELDPQPHQAEAAMMVKHGPFKWIGLDESGKVTVLSPSGTNTAPTVDAIRKQIANETKFVGAPVTTNSELGAILAEEKRAAPVSEGAEQPRTTSAGIPSPAEMRAQIARAEKHSLEQPDKVVQTVLPDGKSPTVVDRTIIEPKGKQAPPKPSYKDEDDAIAAAEKADMLQAFSQSFEEIEVEPVVDPDLLPADPFAVDEAGPALEEMSMDELRAKAKELKVKDYKSLSHPMLLRAVASRVDD